MLIPLLALLYIAIVYFVLTAVGNLVKKANSKKILSR